MPEDVPSTDAASADALIRRVDALEKRLAELEDERSIRELLSRYGYHADAGRDDEYLDLFTEDGVYDISMGATAGTPYPDVVRFEGKDALRAFIKDPRAHQKPGFYKQSLHVQGNNVVIHIDGDDAIANGYSMVLRKRAEQPAYLHAAGTNQWTLKRVDGRWLIKERRRRELGHPDTDENLSATPT